MSLLDEIEGILGSSTAKKKRRLKVKEKWMIEEIHPLFKRKFPNIDSEEKLNEFLGWCTRRNFTKKELQVIQMSRDTKLPPHYKTVWNEGDLKEFASWLAGLDAVAIDTETTGLDKHSVDIVGISFYAPHRGYYIPLAHQDDITTSEDAMADFEGGGGYGELIVGEDYIECLPISKVSSAIAPILAKESLKKIFHNYGYDYHIIRRFLGVKVKCDYDTMIGQALLDENHPKALKPMATTYLKIPSDKFETLFGNLCFNRVPILIDPATQKGNMATFYATKDTELTYKMYEFQMRHLNSPSLATIKGLLFDIEFPFINMVVQTEERGVRFDSEYMLGEVKPVLDKEVGELREKIVSYIGDINLNSPAQLSNALYEDLKLPKVNKKKPTSTDKATMNKLRNHHEVINLILEYRKKSKLLDTFVEKLPNTVINGRVHTSFSTVMKTGRMSSSSPRQNWAIVK